MFKLDLTATPYWIDMPSGVQLHVLPARASLMEDVRRALFDNVDTEDDEAAREASVRIGMLGWSKAMARHAIIGWEGVGDETGAPVEPAPDLIDALMEDDRMFQAFRDAYVLPALQRADEGND